jgi:N-acetylglucosamine-6-phosphate deacetylase
MVGAALLDDQSWCSLILDGCHVHAATAKVALRAKRAGKVMWVTDAMPPVGTDETQFELFGGKVTRNGNELRDAKGVLAGSILDMATAVRNGVQQLDLPLAESLRMASVYPAGFLRLGAEHARIAVNARADLVLFDDNLNIGATFIGGRQQGG